jgi:hypothetical protein
MSITKGLRFKREFDLGRLTWSRPDSHIVPFCSVCFTHLPDDEAPLMMWNDDGACAQLCDKCVEDCLEFL